MSQVTCHRCDICALVWAPALHDWWDSDKGGSIDIAEDGFNGGRKWEHLCKQCRKDLIKVIDDKAKELYMSRRGEVQIRFKVEDEK